MGMDVITYQKASEIRDRMPDKYRTLGISSGQVTSFEYITVADITGEGFIDNITLTGTVAPFFLKITMDGITTEFIQYNAGTTLGFVLSRNIGTNPSGQVGIFTTQGNNTAGGIQITFITGQFKTVSGTKLPSGSISESYIGSVPLQFKSSLKFEVKASSTGVAYGSLLGGLKV